MNPTTAIQQRDTGIPASFAEMVSVAEMFCQSGMFADARDVAKAFVKIQAGREIGVPPFAAMRGVSIIQGQAALGATLVAGRMKAHGYDWEEIRRDNEVCALRIIKPNRTIAGVSSFSMADAHAAGLTGKDNWKKYPKSMLFARCITDAARTWAPEVFSGIPVYTPEELGNANTNEDGDAITGSAESRSEVLDRKLNEARAAGIDPDNVNASLATNRINRAPFRPPQHTSREAPPAPVVDAEEAAFAARVNAATSKYELLAIFQEQKHELFGLLGDETGELAYRALLNSHDVKKADQFKSTRPMRIALLDLWRKIRDLKADAQQAAVVDADLFAAEGNPGDETT